MYRVAYQMGGMGKTTYNSTEEAVEAAIEAQRAALYAGDWQRITVERVDCMPMSYWEHRDIEDAFEAMW